MAPNEIQKEVQLLVEGNDERNFFEAFTEHLHLPGVQIQVFDGKDQLRGFLETLAVATGFRKVRSIGIVRDADESADSAFQSVQTALHNANKAIRGSGAEFPVPDHPERLASGRPSLSVMLLPGNGDDGMLETLLCRTFADGGVDRCIDGFFKCVRESDRLIPRPAKARARAYLFTTPDPHVSVGWRRREAVGIWTTTRSMAPGVS